MAVAGYSLEGVADDAAFALGSMTAGAHYASSIDASLSWFAGGKVAVPTMLASDPDSDVATVGGGATMARALVDSHRFTSEHLGVTFGGGVEYRFAKVMRYRGSLFQVLHVPFDGDFEVLLDHVNEVEAIGPLGIGGGVRLQHVFVFTEDDQIQTALEPYFAYEPAERGFVARLGTLVALDEDLGFGFDEGKVLTLRLMLGGTW